MMNSREWKAVWILAGLLWAFPGPAAAAVVIDRYAWEFPECGTPAGADDLIQELRGEVQKILDAGHLSPLYLDYADQLLVAYRTYQEPGRIVATLAWAYPYLTAVQQTAVKAYVAAEFASATFAPWASAPLPSTAGAPRELHPKTKWWYDQGGVFQYRPTVQTLYGVWLYGHRTGDWALVQTYWNSIKSMYSSRSGQGDLYGTMGAHIAMARMAQQFNDTATRTTALGNLQTQLDAGLNFATIEGNAIRDPTWSSPYASNPDMYDSRMNGSTYRGWIFLNLSPEIGRYLAEENAALTAAVLARHAQGLTEFPAWWVCKANYFCRDLTGDEGTGLVPDFYGMLAPVERWVAGANASTLRGQVKSAPTGIGDCYWIEALVQAIEATGTLAWSDVRTPAATPTATPVVSPTPTATVTPTRTATPVVSATATSTLSATRTITRTATPPVTTTPTPSASATSTPSPTVTVTAAVPGWAGNRRLLTPGLEDGINDEIDFGPEAGEVHILDLRGREVFRVEGTGLKWSGRGADGRLCASGEYIAKVKKRDGTVSYLSIVLVK